MNTKNRSLVVGVALITALFAAPVPARADVTGFVGWSRTPAGHSVKGAAFGLGLLIVGFEVEGALHSEDTTKNIPGLKTGMGNIILQTPTGNTQLYVTAGGGLFQETLGTSSETSFATNIGGGVKIGIFGPLRLRADYRVLNLRGSARYPTVQRFYIGANVKF